MSVKNGRRVWEILEMKCPAFRKQGEQTMSTVNLIAFPSKPPSRDGLKRKSRASRLGIEKPLRTIRMKCLDCCCGQQSEVKACTIRDCALWPYRFGRFPRPEELTGMAANQKELFS